MKSLASVITAPFKLIRNRIFFLIFLNGFLLALLVYFFIEDNYESQIFKALATQVKQTSKSNLIDILLSSSFQLTHNLHHGVTQQFSIPPYQIPQLANLDFYLLNIHKALP